MFSQASSLNSSTMAFRGQTPRCQLGSRNRDFDVFFQQCVFRQKPGEWPDSLLLCLKIPSRALSSPFSILGSQGIPPSFRLPYSDFYISHGPLNRLESFGRHNTKQLRSTLKFNFNSRHLLPSDNTTHLLRHQKKHRTASPLTLHRRLVSSTPSLRFYKQPVQVMDEELEAVLKLLLLYFYRNHASGLILGIWSLVVVTMLLVNVFGPLYWELRWKFFILSVCVLYIFSVKLSPRDSDSGGLA